MEDLVRSMKAFNDGTYEINYLSFKNDLKKGLFRNIEVIVNYKNLVGKDSKGGYPIP